MTDNEIHGWVMMGVIAAPFLLFAWLMREWEDRRDRRTFERLNRTRVVYRAHRDRITRKEAADLIDAEEAPFIALAKKHGIIK